MTYRDQAPAALWLVDRATMAASLTDLERQTQRLSADELARADAIADTTRSRHWLVGRIALRLLLERICGAAIRQRPFVVGPAGRPSLAQVMRAAGQRVDFSLADSGHFLLIGIAEGAMVGVDIEVDRVIAMPRPHIDRLMAGAEALVGSATTPLQSWTRIEAFTKASGRSLAATLAAFGIQGHGAGAIGPDEVRQRVRRARTVANVAVWDLPLPDALVGAAAISGSAVPQLAAVRQLDHSSLAQLA